MDKKEKSTTLDKMVVDSIFPYNTNANVIIYGGHESWKNKMKKLLPNVNYTFDNNKKVIKNADLVCIQINCISHNNYHTIINEATKTSTKVLTFEYASPKKCALQIYKTLEAI